jgi:hypothetical protein
MGRIKKYLTPEEKQASRNEASKKYYWKNKKEQDEKSKQRYYRNLRDNKSKK